MGIQEVQTHAKEERTVDRPVNGGEVEWDGEMECTQAEMLDSIKTILKRTMPVIYKGPGAFTVAELVTPDGMCAATVRKEARKSVDAGELVEVTVMRRNRSNKPFYTAAYVEPNVYERFMDECE